MTKVEVATRHGLSLFQGVWGRDPGGLFFDFFFWGEESQGSGGFGSL